MLSLLFPSTCMACTLLLRRTASGIELCSACLAELEPAPASHGDRDGIASAFGYEGPLATTLARLKYGRDLAVAGPLGRALALHPTFAAPTWDLALPVPLHPWRRLARGFNQVGLLCEHAFGVHRGLAPRLRFDLLRRIRATPSQTTLPADRRRANVEGAFAVPPAARASIEGRSLLVIDDVTTTGATLKACADALRHAGAVRVDALALLRTVA